MILKRPLSCKGRSFSLRPRTAIVRSKALKFKSTNRDYHSILKQKKTTFRQEELSTKDPQFQKTVSISQSTFRIKKIQTTKFNAPVETKKYNRRRSLVLNNFKKSFVKVQKKLLNFKDKKQLQEKQKVRKKQKKKKQMKSKQKSKSKKEKKAQQGIMIFQFDDSKMQKNYKSYTQKIQRISKAPSIQQRQRANLKQKCKRQYKTTQRSLSLQQFKNIQQFKEIEPVIYHRVRSKIKNIQQKKIQHKVQKEQKKGLNLEKKNNYLKRIQSSLYDKQYFKSPNNLANVYGKLFTSKNLIQQAVVKKATQRRMRTMIITQNKLKSQKLKDQTLQKLEGQKQPFQEQNPVIQIKIIGVDEILKSKPSKQQKPHQLPADNVLDASELSAQKWQEKVQEDKQKLLIKPDGMNMFEIMREQKKYKNSVRVIERKWKNRQMRKNMMKYIQLHKIQLSIPKEKPSKEGIIIEKSEQSVKEKSFLVPSDIQKSSIDLSEQQKSINKPAIIPTYKRGQDLVVSFYSPIAYQYQIWHLAFPEKVSQDPERYRFKLYISNYNQIQDFISFEYDYKKDQQVDMFKPKFQNMWQQIIYTISPDILPEIISKTFKRKKSFQIFINMYKNQFSGRFLNQINQIKQEIYIQEQPKKQTKSVLSKIKKATGVNVMLPFRIPQKEPPLAFHIKNSLIDFAFKIENYIKTYLGIYKYKLNNKENIAILEQNEIKNRIKVIKKQVKIRKEIRQTNKFTPDFINNFCNYSSKKMSLSLKHVMCGKIQCNVNEKVEQSLDPKAREAKAKSAIKSRKKKQLKKPVYKKVTPNRRYKKFRLKFLKKAELITESYGELEYKQNRITIQTKGRIMQFWDVDISKKKIIKELQDDQQIQIQQPMKLPLRLLNNEILLQGIFKQNGSFLMYWISYCDNDPRKKDKKWTSKQIASLKFKISVQQQGGGKAKGKWNDSTFVTLKQLLKLCKSQNRLKNLQTFLLYQRFSSRQQKEIQSKLQERLQIEDSVLKFKRKITKKFEMKKLSVKNVQKNIELFHHNQQNQRDIYNKLKFLNMEKMKYYNSFKWVEQKIFNYRFHGKGGRIKFFNIRILKNKYGKENIKVQLYEPFRLQMYYIVIKNEFEIVKIYYFYLCFKEKLLNALQLEGEGKMVSSNRFKVKNFIIKGYETKSKQLLFERLITTQNSLVGRRIVFKEDSPHQLFNDNQYELKWMLYNNPNDNYLQKYFQKTPYYTVQNIPGYGKIYLNIDIYSAQNKKISKENQWMVRFKITPCNSKTKVFKFVMNYQDIITSKFDLLPIEVFQKNYIKPMNKDLPIDQQGNTMSNVEIYHYIKKHFVSNLYYADSGNYKVFYLTDNSKISPFIFKNDFDKYLYAIKEQTKGFNVKYQNEFLVKSKQTKRIGNQFFLFSVYMYTRLNYWQMKVYNAQTTRLFTLCLCPAEVEDIIATFLAKLLWLSDDLFLMRDYWDEGNDVTLKYLVDKLVKFKSNQEGEQYDEEATNDILSKIVKDKVEKNRKISPYQFESIKFSLDKKVSRRKLWFWEKLITKLVIRQSENNKIRANIDNYVFKGSFHEELHSSFIQILNKSHNTFDNFHNYYDVQLQIQISPKNEKEISLQKFFYKITRQNLSDYNIIIQLNYVQKMITQKEIFSLKEIIEIYDKDSIAKKIKNQNKEVFPLNYLKFICYYIKNKLHRHDLSTLKKQRVEAQQPNKQIKVDRHSRTHSSIDIIQKVDTQQILQKQIVLFKCALTTKPLQMFILKYDEVRETFTIIIYNTLIRKTFFRHYSKEEVTEKIIYINYYLKLKQYRKLGQLIFKAYKNDMIYHSFQAF